MADFQNCFEKAKLESRKLLLLCFLNSIIEVNKRIKSFSTNKICPKLEMTKIIVKNANLVMWMAIMGHISVLVSVAFPKVNIGD